MFNLREFVFHHEFLVLGVTSQHDWLVADKVQSIFVEFMLEVVLRADGKLVFAIIFLCNLQNSVTPVVGAFGVLGVVHCEISDDIRVFKVASALAGTVSNQTMAKKRICGDNQNLASYR